jgi:hypothetical protein
LFEVTRMIPFPPIPSPVRIDPDAVYTVGAIVLTLDIPSTTIDRARRTGELKYVRRGHRIYVLGRNLLAWLTPAASTQMGEAVRA